MKAETQIGLAVAIFFAGWMVGYTLRTEQWIGADGVTAAGTVGLVVAAVIGYFAWKKQFILQRDHDIAMRLIEAINECAAWISHLRTEGMLVTDPVYVPSGPNLSPEQLRFELELSKYRSRRARLADAAVRRHSAHQLALVTWRDDALSKLVNGIEGLEATVGAHVDRYVNSLRPGNARPEAFDASLVFKSASGDRFNNVYLVAVMRVLAHLGPRLRLEKDTSPDTIDPAVLAMAEVPTKVSDPAKPTGT
jgi:hypothetical protein